MTDDKALVWEEIEREQIVKDEWMDLRRSTFRFPDGRVFSPYYSYTRRDYAVVVASDENGDFICVRQYRQGIRRVTTEFPAGGLERKDRSLAGGDEIADALAGAQRELREETGYESSDWRFLMRVPACATLSDNYAYLFRARNCRKSAEQNLDEMELLRVEKHAAADIDALIQEGEFLQTDHILAWLLSARA